MIRKPRPYIAKPTYYLHPFPEGDGFRWSPRRKQFVSLDAYKIAATKMMLQIDLLPHSERQVIYEIGPSRYNKAERVLALYRPPKPRTTRSRRPQTLSDI